MKFIRILSLFAIIAIGGYLAYQNNLAKSEVAEINVPAITEMAADGELLEVEAPETETAMGRAWGKIKNAFDGKRDAPVVEEAVVQNAAKDHGRLQGLFKSAPASTPSN